MKATSVTVIDGQTYQAGEEIPDLGNLVCVKPGKQREYLGFTSDKLKLPKYDDLLTGSSATLIDPNGIEDTIIAKYYASTKQWLDMRGGVIV